jgi:hypothetical protein
MACEVTSKLQMETAYFSETLVSHLPELTVLEPKRSYFESPLPRNSRRLRYVVVTRWSSRNSFCEIGRHGVFQTWGDIPRAHTAMNVFGKFRYLGRSGEQKTDTEPTRRGAGGGGGGGAGTSYWRGQKPDLVEYAFISVMSSFDDCTN